MKILIGILFSGESQYEACKAAIQSQSHTDWELVEFKNLGKKEAHEALFKAFTERADDVDLFVKIDADMELCHPDFLKTLAEYFAAHEQIDHVTMKVNDFYTARLIWGLNAFRSTVRFSASDDVYTDQAALVDPARRVHLKRHPILVPAVLHAFDPTDYQSFHFGCHKAIKVMHRQSRSHFRNIRRLPWAALIRRDKRPLLAYAGAALTFENELPPSCLDHGNTDLHELFEPLAALSAIDLMKQLPRYRKAVTTAQKRYLAR